MGRLSGAFPHRRSLLVGVCLGATVATWSAVILWAGTSSTWLLIALVLALSSNVPASMVGLDIARQDNAPERLGMATGITNSGGFFAALIAILLIGVTLDVVSSGSGYTSADFRVAMTTQYAVWIVGVAFLLRARARLSAQARSAVDDNPRS